MVYVLPHDCPTSSKLFPPGLTSKLDNLIGVHMKQSLTARGILSAAVFTLLLLPVVATSQDVFNSPYVVTGETGSVHIYPTPEVTRQIMAQQGPQVPGALTYHGGPIMTGLNLYAIFWVPVPAKLQNGKPTGLTTKYESVAKQFLADYPYHGIANNSTQYYSTKTGVNTYFVGIGALVASVVDTDPYPASGCTDPDTPGNCITDLQLQKEIAKVMKAHGWTPGLNKIYIVFTSTGEGSCMNGGSCAYTQYCAYHGYFGSATNPTIYTNQPYADPKHCYASFAPYYQHAPSGDIPSDANVNVTSHEITEATTDPELNAWWDPANGEEIGDLCGWHFGGTTGDWDGGLANQRWNAHYYDLQLEYDNHTAACVKVGP